VRTGSNSLVVISVYRIDVDLIVVRSAAGIDSFYVFVHEVWTVVDDEYTMD
jgi:hypothetical protein